MDVVMFTTILKSKFDFDCFENSLFEGALNSVFQEANNTVINDVSFFDFYSQEKQFEEMILNLLQRLKLLLSSIPESDSKVVHTILGVHLNQYSLSKNKLLLQVSQLESRWINL